MQKKNILSKLAFKKSVKNKNFDIWSGSTKCTGEQ